MDRVKLPATGAEPDMAMRVTEVRVVERSRGHEERGGEARA